MRRQSDPDLKIGGQLRPINASFAIMAPRHGILIEKQ
jgi:hypothetical protein